MTLLLSSIAIHHRVVVVARAPTPSRSFMAGRYRMKTRAEHVADAIADLMRAPGQPVAVLVDATAWRNPSSATTPTSFPVKTRFCSKHRAHRTRAQPTGHQDRGWLVDRRWRHRVELRINEWGLTEQVG